jgi:dTDP-glucose 4,6-dehydratase
MTQACSTFRLMESVRGYWSGLSDTHRDVGVAATKVNLRFLHVSADEVCGSLGKDDPAFAEWVAHVQSGAYREWDIKQYEGKSV